MRFELTREYIDALIASVKEANVNKIKELIYDLHPADIAEIFNELEIEEAHQVYLHLDKEKASDVLIELEEDVREEFLSYLSGEEIAKDIENMDSDDAADIIGELPEDKKDEVLSHIKDVEQAGDIVDLLSYHEDTAGGLMAKELIAVNENLTVDACLDEIRRQAEEVDEIYFVYVIDNDNMLTGTLPLKQLLISSGNTKVKDICFKDVISVKTNTNSEDVANIMEKYDLVALPVIDSIGRLKGRITIDDVVDVIKEEAEKDYQMISGISSDVEASDNVFQLTKARIPWLLIGLTGGVFGATIIGHFEHCLSDLPRMAVFIPLIAAMGGNVGIQSSSIIVQGLANNSLGLESTSRKLLKELSVALVNGLICSSILFMFNLLFNDTFGLTISVSIALLTVTLFASMFGTLVPLALHRIKIDPALATGPFITTTNDVVGMFIYFGVSKLILGF